MSVSKDPVEALDTTASEDGAPEDDTAEADNKNSLTRDDTFHILQCRRRRLVLKYLQEHDTPAKMTDITEHIAAVEHDTTVAALKSQERQRVYIALYQSHLPKLDEEGVIVYKQNRGIVEATERTDAFDRYLDQEPSMRKNDVTQGSTTELNDRDRGGVASGRQWSRWHAGGVGFALAIAVTIYANLPGTPIPSGAGIALAAITFFTLIATRTMDEPVEDAADAE